MKNSPDFIEKVKDITLQEGIIPISIDHSSLFPSVQIPHTVGYLREMLSKISIKHCRSG